jgi:hypothetical protein
MVLFRGSTDKVRLVGVFKRMPQHTCAHTLLAPWVT